MIVRPLIEAVARPLGLNPDIAEAIVRVEDRAGDPYAWNPEPRYRYLWNVRVGKPFRPLTDVERASEVPPPDFPCLAGDPDQEWWGQQASWGFFQIMGAVAREHGFREPFLPALCDPMANVTLGCRIVRDLVLWADGDVAQAAAAYNAGKGGWKSDAGLAYGAKVLAALAEIERERRAG